MTEPTKIIKIEVPVKKFRRSRKDWDGHCHEEESYCDGDARPCEAPELCWPNNCCFREGTDKPLVARPTETVLMVPKSDLDSALGRIAELESTASREEAPAAPQQSFTASPLAETGEAMVDMVPPATARDRWMYQQGRLAERDPRTHRGELIEELCARIKAADDLTADADYMLDSNDCIAVLRGTWSSDAAAIRAKGGEAVALHPATADLVSRFSDALADKLSCAEKKYGYIDGWLRADWMDECRAKLLEHVAKGDPRDVAAYCAFLWHHGESTALAAKDGAAGQEQAGAVAKAMQDAWNDWCSDTGCFPDDFTLKGKTLTFEAGRWAASVAAHLAAPGAAIAARVLATSPMSRAAA